MVHQSFYVIMSDMNLMLPSMHHFILQTAICLFRVFMNVSFQLFDESSTPLMLHISPMSLFTAFFQIVMKMTSAMISGIMSYIDYVFMFSMMFQNIFTNETQICFTSSVIPFSALQIKYGLQL